MKQSWIKGWLSGKPHFIIGGADDPYLYRWYVIPRNRFFNIYLHKFLRDDDDRALHDHPWWFVSIMLKGGYWEWMDKGLTFRVAPSIAFRTATHKHRVELLKDRHRRSIPCWTVVITGHAKRTWGFWCPQGFIKWSDFVAPSDAGSVGKGCDQ